MELTHINFKTNKEFVMSHIELGPDGPIIHGQDARAFDDASGLHFLGEPSLSGGDEVVFQPHEQQQHSAGVRAERISGAAIPGGAAAVKAAIEAGVGGPVYLMPRMKY